MLDARAMPAAVPLFARGGSTQAAVSGAAIVGHLVSLSAAAQQQARDAGALEAILPLLDGGTSAQPAEQSAAVAIDRTRRS